MATIAEKLEEARFAYHELQLGRAPASVRDQNGEEIRYTKADPSALLAYIAALENQLPGATSSVIGPMVFWF